MTFYPSPTTGLGVAAKIVVPGNTAPAGQESKAGVNGYNNVVLSLSGTNGPTTFQLEPQLQDAAGNEVAAGTQFTLTSVATGSEPQLTLTAVAAASGNQAVYTGTITGGGSNAFEGYSFTIAGFQNAANNGTFVCVASTTTTLTLVNEFTIAETHAATAQSVEGNGVYTGTITGGGSNAFAGETFVVAGFTNAQNNGTFICTASSTTTLTLNNPNSTTETHAATATAQESGNSLTYVAYGFKTNSGGTYKPVNGGGESVVTVSSTGLITAVAEGGSVVEVSYPTFNNTIGDISSSGNIMNGLPIQKVYGEVSVTVVA
jgi:hypothetical protein